MSSSRWSLSSSSTSTMATSRDREPLLLPPEPPLFQARTDAYQVYRKTLVGEALMAAIAELIAEKSITNDLGVALVHQFDHTVAKVLANAREKRKTYKFKGVLAAYRRFPFEGEGGGSVYLCRFQVSQHEAPYH